MYPRAVRAWALLSRAAAPGTETAIGRGVVDEPELRSLYQRLIARRAPADRTACVDPDRLLATAEGSASERERIAALRHVAACGLCREELDLLRSATEAGRGMPERRASPALALAASVALAIGAIGLWQVGPKPEVLRGAGDELAVIAPAGDQAPGTLPMFVWRSRPTALRYEIEVTDPDGMPAFERTTSDTVVSLPPSAALRPGTEYRWWVRAILPGGAQLRSRTQRFRIRQP